jgi:hypothetical protein
MAGCLIHDLDSFEHVTERYGHVAELKFHDHPWLREEILKSAAPLVDTVYYVQFSKRKNRWNGRGDKHALHTSILYSLIRGIANDLTTERVDAIIDHNSLIGDDEARDLVREVFEESGIRSNPLVGDSMSNYGLQTNDFFVGSVGYLFNTPDEDANPPRTRYVSYFLDKMVEVPFRDYRGKIDVKSRNHRQPCSLAPCEEQGHTCHRQDLRRSDAPHPKWPKRHTDDWATLSEYLRETLNRGWGAKLTISIQYRLLIN